MSFELFGYIAEQKQSGLPLKSPSSDPKSVLSIVTNICPFSFMSLYFKQMYHSLFWPSDARCLL